MWSQRFIKMNVTQMFVSFFRAAQSQENLQSIEKQTDANSHTSEIKQTEIAHLSCATFFFCIHKIAFLKRPALLSSLYRGHRTPVVVHKMCARSLVNHTHIKWNQVTGVIIYTTYIKIKRRI